MDKGMTREELEAIRARCDAATPGPWEMIPDIRPDVINPEIRSKAKNTGYCGGGQIVKDLHKSPGHICEFAKYYKPHSNIADAEFIASARQDIPALLAHIDQLQEKRDGWAQACCGLSKKLEEAHAEIDRLTALVDAAVNDVHAVKSCRTCFYADDDLCRQAEDDNDYKKNISAHERWQSCKGSAKLNWQWRGLGKESKGE